MYGEIVQVELKSPNWLPLPIGLGTPRAVQQEVDETDLFSKGVVVKFFPQQGWGFLSPDRGGKDLYFRLEELDFVGPKQGKEFLQEGMRVGFDISWTSRGPHVSKLKNY